MFDVRNWERFQFFLDCEHQTVSTFLSAGSKEQVKVECRNALRAEQDSSSKGTPTLSEANYCQDYRKSAVLKGSATLTSTPVV